MGKVLVAYATRTGESQQIAELIGEGIRLAVLLRGIEGFGLSVFVTDRFVDDFCSSPQPHLPALLYEQMLAGRHGLLQSQQLAAATATRGLHT
mgnify:CR=1 FL=1